MLINNENLQGLRVTFSAAFNKAFETTTTNKDKVATTVPSSSKLNTYGWLGDFPSMREWIGQREVKNLSEKAYNIINKHFEMTIGVERDDIEDDNLGIYSIQMQQMGQSAKEHQDILAIGMLPRGFTEKCYDDKTFLQLIIRSVKKLTAIRARRSCQQQAMQQQGQQWQASETKEAQQSMYIRVF